MKVISCPPNTIDTDIAVSRIIGLRTVSQGKENKTSNSCRAKNHNARCYLNYRIGYRNSFPPAPRTILFRYAKNGPIGPLLTKDEEELLLTLRVVKAVVKYFNHYAISFSQLPELAYRQVRNGVLEPVDKISIFYSPGDVRQGMHRPIEFILIPTKKRLRKGSSSPRIRRIFIPKTHYSSPYYPSPYQNP